MIRNVKKIATSILAGTMVISGMTFPVLEIQASEGDTQSKRVVVYFPNWGLYSAAHQNMKVSDLPWDKITHINHAFFTVGEDNRIVSTDDNADFSWSGKDGHFGDYEEYSKTYPDVEVLISVGGWTKSHNFHDMAMTKASRAEFIDSTLDLMEEWDFIDGFDIDWEYPGVDRDADPNDQYDMGSPGGEEDRENYTLLLKEMREAFDSHGYEDKLLTAAVPASPAKAQAVNPDEYSQYLDYINVMNYDIHGAWDSVTGHQSPIYDNPNFPYTESHNLTLEATLEFYHEEYGIPKDKLVGGTPFYSRGWGGVTANSAEEALFATATGNYLGLWDDPANPYPGGQEPYWKIKQYEQSSEWEKGYDEYSKVPYLYNKSKKVFLTYEDEQSLTERANFINDNGYGGLIAWEISGDVKSSYPLTTIMYEQMVGQYKDVLPRAAKIESALTDKYNEAKITVTLPSNAKTEKITIKDNDKIITEITTNDSKSVYEYTASNLTDGAHTFTVISSNSKGITNGTSSTKVTVDAPKLKAVEVSANKTSSQGTHTISVKVPAFNKGTNVALYENDVVVQNFTVTKESKDVQTLTFEAKGLTTGTYNYVAKITDGTNTLNSNSVAVNVRDASAGDFELDQKVTSSWGTGFNFSGVLTNKSDYTYKNVEITFKSDQKIDSVWSDLTLVKSSGNTYTLKPASYMANEFKPGNSYSFGGGGQGNPDTFLIYDIQVNGDIDMSDVLPVAPTVKVNKTNTNGQYSLTVNAPANNKGETLEIYENDVLVKSVALNGTNETTIDFNKTAYGTYNYYAKIVNAHGEAKSSSVSYTYEKPVLKAPSISVNKATNNGDYKLTVTAPSNSTATKVAIFENGTKVYEENVTALSQNDQNVSFVVNDKAVGSYSYVAKSFDGTTELSSSALNVNVVAEEVKEESLWPSQVFAPYVDVTLWDPKYKISEVTDTDFFVLAFIVSDGSLQPIPTWGGYSSYDMTYFQEEIAKVRARGGDVMISIGGAINSPIAATAKTAQETKDIYAEIIDAYDLTKLDFDIEGNWVAHPESIQRRAEAIKLLQEDPEYSDVEIWYTLPVLPTGLDYNGLNVVKNAVQNGVRLDGVNVMAMEYGTSFVPTKTQPGDLGNIAIDVIENLKAQLNTVYKNDGQNKTEEELYDMIGITPMFGQNINKNEVFYAEDAEILADYVNEKGVGLLSMWSLERDQAGKQAIGTYNHSGIQSGDLEFTKIFSQIMDDEEVTTPEVVA
ncbi:MAG: glycosyl hydrolase family 18 protein, partial [Lachnospirales bacterium]